MSRKSPSCPAYRQPSSSQLLSKEDAEAGKKAYEVLETYKGKDFEDKED